MGNSQAGRRAAAFLESRIPPGESLRGFCLRIGFDNTAHSRWANGAQPTIDSLERLAHCLGLSLGQLLVGAGILEATDAGAQPVPAAPEAPDIDRAIELDPTLSEDERELLRGLRRMLAGSNSDGVDRITVSTHNVTRRNRGNRSQRRE